MTTNLISCSRGSNGLHQEGNMIKSIQGAENQLNIENAGLLNVIEGIHN